MNLALAWSRITIWLSERKVLLGIGALALVLAAIHYIWWLSKHVIPIPGAFDGSSDAAQDYCARLASESSQTATAHYVYGWMLTIVVVIAAAVALAKVQKAEDRLVWIACITAGACVARSMLSRADASGELAAAATVAQTIDHPADSTDESGTSKTVFETCTQAWAAWLKSRTDSSAIARAALEQSIKGLQQSSDTATTSAQNQATQAKETARTATDVVARTGEDVSNTADQIKQVAHDMAKVPGQAERATQLVELSTQIKSTVGAAADQTLKSAVDIAGFVVVVATDASLKGACITSSKLGLPTRIYSDGGRTKWMTVLGPAASRGDAEDLLKSASGKVRADSMVTQMRPAWTPATCAPTKQKAP